MSDKKDVKKEILYIILFAAVFLVLFTAATLIFYPKWSAGEESNLSNGIDLEEKNSVDVLLIGSCNMYTSFNPLLFYESTGITSFDRACPDQLMSASYYYLEEAFKHQSPKVVVVDSLFLTEDNSKSREFFDREAVDYMLPSPSKTRLMNELADVDYNFMLDSENTGPDRLLTKAGYYLPLLRYHSRSDITAEDFTFFFKYDRYNTNKGCAPFFTYTDMDGLQFDRVNNETVIRDDAERFVPKIMRLCEKNNAELLFINTPNKYRWDKETTSVVRKYIERLGGTFADLTDGKLGDFEEYEYQTNTGRLNIYGMRKFTELFGQYLIDTYSLTPSELSEKTQSRWENDTESLYTLSEENGCNLYQGQIAQIKNENHSIMLRWNSNKDAEKYRIYRKAEDEEKFSFLSTAHDCVFYDENVENGRHYYYYVASVSDGKKITKSEKADYIFIEAPNIFTAENENGTVTLSWDENRLASDYVIQKRRYGADRFSDFLTAPSADSVTDSEVERGTYYYRIRTALEENGNTYYSDSVICKTRITD